MRVTWIAAVLFLTLLLLPALASAIDLSLLSPSLSVYNVTTAASPTGNLTFAFDYLNGFSDRNETFLQVDNRLYSVRNDDQVSIFTNPVFTQDGTVVIPSRIVNGFVYSFSLYLTERKDFNLSITNAKAASPSIMLQYHGNASSAPGWFCLDDGDPHQLMLPDTLYYDLSVRAHTNGLYYTSYDVYQKDRLVATCGIRPGALSSIDLIRLQNDNKEKIITKSALTAGTYAYPLGPGYHQVILYAYNRDGVLYNVTKAFFVIIDGCGDLRCDRGEVCPFDCSGRQNATEYAAALSNATVPAVLQTLANQNPFVVSTESKDRIVQQGPTPYIVFDLSKGQYTAQFVVSALQDAPFYAEDYYYYRTHTNLTGLFSFTLGDQILGGSVVQLQKNRNYVLTARLTNLSKLSIGENSGIFDFGGQTTIYYQVLMPRSIYSQIHLPQRPPTPTFLDDVVGVVREHKLAFALAVAVILLLIFLVRQQRKRIRRVKETIQRKYGIELD